MNMKVYNSLNPLPPTSSHAGDEYGAMTPLGGTGTDRDQKCWDEGWGFLTYRVTKSVYRKNPGVPENIKLTCDRILL